VTPGQGRIITGVPISGPFPGRGQLQATRAIQRTSDVPDIEPSGAGSRPRPRGQSHPFGLCRSIRVAHNARPSSRRRGTAPGFVRGELVDRTSAFRRLPGNKHRRYGEDVLSLAKEGDRRQQRTGAIRRALREPANRSGIPIRGHPPTRFGRDLT